ncbi:MAG: cobalt chelatase [Burkholderiaceae bacterium]
MNNGLTTESQQAHERELQRIEELCAASIRALSGQPDLHFRGSRLHRGLKRLPSYAPHLHPKLEDDDFSSFRGASDGIALRLTHSDPEIHKQHSPAEPTARILYEMFEQFRVEAMAPPEMIGVKRNLQHRFDEWSLAFHHSGLTETLSGLILYTVAQTSRARVHGSSVLEATEDLIETTRGKLISLTGPQLAAMRKLRHDQAQYAPEAKVLSEKVTQMLKDIAREANGSDDDGGSGDEDDEPLANGRFSLWMDFDGQDDAGVAIATTERSKALDAATDGYTAFTREYDQTHRTADIVRAAQLREYRERLDQLIQEQGLNARRLARRLKAVLAEPVHDGWEGAQEEGRIDGSRLAQLVSSPAERRLFKADRIEPIANCALTFLIDCSGSMKTHAESVAMLVDLMSRALEQAGVTSEILGFTTGAWNGGRARKDWERARKPQHPGRLNERWHLIFKDAEQSWRRARPSISALLKADMFREGIDGEAVDWACQRLHERNEERKILIVISDGCPMDSATQLANDDTYLDQHLMQVVQKHEEQGAIQIFGIGVGLDLSVFYSRCQAVDLTQGLRFEVFGEIIELISGHRRR